MTPKSLLKSHIPIRTLSGWGGRYQDLTRLPSNNSWISLDSQSKVDSTAEVTHLHALRLQSSNDLTSLKTP